MKKEVSNPLLLGILEVLMEINGVWKLVAVIDLDHGVLHHVVFVPLELEVEDGGELFENDTLLGLLQTVSLRVILVVALQSFHQNVVVKRLLEIFQPLHVQLNIWHNIQEKKKKEGERDDGTVKGNKASLE